MAGANQYRAADFIKAIKGTGGIISAIANKVPCDWHTAKKYIVNYPTIARAYDDECQKISDLAESELYKAIKAGEAWAIKFYLMTKARNRGYIANPTDGEGGKQVVEIIMREVIVRLPVGTVAPGGLDVLSVVPVDDANGGTNAAVVIEDGRLVEG